MANLRVVEIYKSVQGEGPRTGLPTIFLRFAGCNMRCPGWPCDTEHAINPAIYNAGGGSKSYWPNELLKALAEVDDRIKHVCITGGEPFVQPANQLQEFVELAIAAGYSFECFTNGSFIFPTWAMHSMTFMMDWKLSGSGEANTGIDSRLMNAKRLRRVDGIKFVISEELDIIEVKNIAPALIAGGSEAELWIGAAWSKIEPGHLVELILDSPVTLRLNLQTHKYIWPADMKGV